MNEIQAQLSKIRIAIDDVDAQVIELLNRRIQLAIEVGKIKQKGDAPFFAPERERQIYESLAERNEGPLQTKQLVGIFREIISASRAAEQPLHIAYWGPEGSYSHLAATQTFGSSSEFHPLDSIASVFQAVENRIADYGVAPIENSIAGVVPETLDMFPLTNVKICAENYVMVQHLLVSNAKSLSEIERVYAGPQPFAQCRRWLRENLPKAEVVEIMPTSEAARRAAKDEHGAAIANRLAAESNGLGILAEAIADNAKNETRFLVIGFNEPIKTGRDKTSIVFNLRNKPGELYRALGILDSEAVNLSMIESRPVPRTTFEYLFYCDLEGHRTDPNVDRAMESLKSHALELIWLGSYPQATERR